MALLSGHQLAAKSASVVVTMDKSVVSALSSVVADSYYSVSSNIKTIAVIYRSASGQKKVLYFDATQASPTADLIFSAFAHDAFEIAGVELYDFDGGVFRVSSANVATLGCSITLGGGSGGGGSGGGGSGGGGLTPLNLTGTLTSIAGNGTGNYLDGFGTNARINNPWGLGYYSGHLYFVDTANYRIRKVNVSTNEVTTVSGIGYSTSIVDGDSSVATYVYPTDAQMIGNILYFMDQDGALRALDVSTNTVSTKMYVAADSAFFAIDNSSQYVYVNAGYGKYIRKYDFNTGAEITRSGQPWFGATDYSLVGYEDGSNSVAKIWNGRGMVIGPDGHLYFSANYAIRKVDVTSATITTIAGALPPRPDLTDGTRGNLDGIGGAARLGEIRGLYSDGSFLYFQDYDNHTGEARIKKMNLSTNEVITVVGGMTAWGDLASDGTNLYAAGWNEIYKIS